MGKGARDINLYVQRLAFYHGLQQPREEKKRFFDLAERYVHGRQKIVVLMTL